MKAKDWAERTRLAKTWQTIGIAFFLASALWLSPKVLSAALLNHVYVNLAQIAVDHQSWDKNLMWAIGLRNLGPEQVSNDLIRARFDQASNAWVRLANPYSAKLATMIMLLQRVALLSNDQAHIRRLHTRLLLAADRPEEAVEVLERGMLAGDSADALLWSELGDAYHASGRFDAALSAYRSARFLGRQNLFYYDLPSSYKWTLSGSKLSSCGRQSWDYSLGALLNIRQRAFEANDRVLVDALESRLRFFPAESLMTTIDPCINTLEIRAMLLLVEEGIWSRQTLARVISFLVWKAPAEEAEIFLQELLRLGPASADSFYYLGQFYHRQGKLEQAEAAYRQAIFVDRGHAQAQLGLAMVLEAMGNVKRDSLWLREALRWYELYAEAMPDDLLVIRKLGQIHMVLGNPDKANAWNAEFDSRTDEVAIAAELLGISRADLKLGENLIANPDFEDGTDQPDKWERRLDIGGKNGAALVGSGLDYFMPFQGAQQLRTAGLWWQVRDNQGEPGVGYWGRLKDDRARDLEPETSYLLSFYYKTTLEEGWTSAVLHPVGVWPLPPTYGRWRKFAMLAHNRSNKVLGLPVPCLTLCGKGVGDVYFDAMSLRRIFISPDVTDIHESVKPVVR